MGILNKRGVETVDYTLLQKKGFIKKPEKRKMPYKVNSSGEIDFTSMANGAIMGDAVSSVNNTGASNPFNFLDNLAQSASNTFNSSNSNTNDNFLTSSSALSSDSAEMNAFKIKLDDFEFKISQLVDKLTLIESKLENFEKKVFN
ncbi:MAG: hypothetical protein AABX85_03535 [Nanoarchaeota archaeon]